MSDVSVITGERTNQGDWKKLVRLLGFLKNTRLDVLTLEADDHQSLYWMIDASFGVHPDMRSHTGGIFSLGKGAIIAEISIVVCQELIT